MLLAAGIHAGWNTLVKGSSNKWVSIATIVVDHILLSIVALPGLPFPSSERFPYAVVIPLQWSVDLYTTGYLLFWRGANENSMNHTKPC